MSRNRESQGLTQPTNAIPPFPRIANRAPSNAIDRIFDIGRIWVDTTANEAYMKVGNASGASIWKHLTNTTEAQPPVDLSGYIRAANPLPLSNLRLGSEISVSSDASIRATGEKLVLIGEGNQKAIEFIAADGRGDYDIMAEFGVLSSGLQSISGLHMRSNNFLVFEQAPASNENGDAAGKAVLGAQGTVVKNIPGLKTNDIVLATYEGSVNNNSGFLSCTITAGTLTISAEGGSDATGATVSYFVIKNPVFV